MFPILFKIGSLTFYTHGFLAVLGIVVGSLLLYLLAKKKGLNCEYLIDNVIYSVLAGIVGARLTYFFLYRDQFASWKEIFFLWNGGMVSYGGFILGGIALVLLLWRQKEKVLDWLDLISIAFASGLVLGRLGNLFAGEYSGVPSKFGLGGVVPVTLYEGIYVLIIGGLLSWLYLRGKNLKSGQIFWSFLFLYGIGRFVIDFWRDEASLVLGISLGQTVSLVVLVVAAVFLVLGRWSKRKKLSDFV